EPGEHEADDHPHGDEEIGNVVARDAQALRRQGRDPADHQDADEAEIDGNDDPRAPQVEDAAEREIERQHGEEGAGGSGDPGEMRPSRRRWQVAVDVEPGKAEAAADREDEGEDPAETRRVAEGEEEDEKGGSNAEIDEIRQGIEFGAEGARDLQLAGEKPVEPVDHRGEDDEERGELEILLEGEADGAEPGREAEDGDEIGQEMEERQAA